MVNDSAALLDNQICLVMIQNPFDFKNYDKRVVDLDIDGDVFLSQLLPNVYNTYVVSVNGEIVDKDKWSTFKVKSGQYIVFCPIPEGGGSGGGKTILRMVALIGLSFFTFGAASAAYPTLAGTFGIASGAAQFATFAGGSFLINSLLPATLENSLEDLSKSPSYGIDGPKNTSKEGIPVPVVYGKYRVAGNLINIHTENHAEESQYIYMLFALSEGQISGIEEDSVLINNRAISEFNDREILFVDGNSTQKTFDDNVNSPIQWFEDTIRMNTVATKLSHETATSYTTSGPCDRVRVDLLFPDGLKRVSDGGKIGPHSVEFEASIDGDPFYNVADIESDLNGRSKIYVYNYYQKSFTNYIERTDTYSVQSTVEAGTFESNGILYKTVVVNPPGNKKDDLESRTYEVGFVTYDPNDVPYNADWKVYGESNSAHRVTYYSGDLEYKIHTVSIKRKYEEQTGPSKFDSCYIQDIGEILNDKVEYRNTALLGIKIRATDQLTSIPSVSVVVHGKLCNSAFYSGSSGLENHYEWTDNPAVIAMDMLTNTRYGAGVPIERLNIHAFGEWRIYCEAKKLKFNGVFDTNMAIWDALQSVFRVGRAQLVNMGTIFSVAMEAPGSPTMMFNVGNIVENSFKIDWLPLQDRANEIEISYFDAENDYKQTTLRMTDSLADPSSASNKTASITLYGCTDKDQAIAEAELMLRMNRYILQTITFDSPIEAIACTVGDLIYVQHDVPQWAFGGRLKPGSTTNTLKLDKPVSLVGGEPHVVLLHLDSLQRGLATITGNPSPEFVQLDNYPLARYRKLVIGDNEYTIQGFSQTGFGVNGLVLDRPLAEPIGSTVSLVDIDLIEEVTITTIENDGLDVNLATDLPFSPPAFTKFLFGPVDRSKKPFRVMSISGGSDFTRTITALEYHESVYGETADFVPPINVSLLGLIAHVTDLTYDLRTIKEAGQVLPVIHLNWKAPQSGAYSGADIYVRQEDGVWQLAGEARHGITTFTYKNAVYGEKLQFKVQSFDALGKRAEFESAPSTDWIDLSTHGISAPPVLDIAVTEQVNFPVTALQIYSTLHVNITPPTIAEDPDGKFNHAVIDYRLLTSEEWITLGNTVDTLPLKVLRTGQTYRFRARSSDVNGVVSTEEKTVDHTVTTAAVTLAPTVERLRLVNGANGDQRIFTGNAVQLAWDQPDNADWHEVGNPPTTTHASEFDHYSIDVIDNNNVVVGSYNRNTPDFVYTYAMNESDYAASYGTAGANRQLIFRVYVHGKNLQVSGQPAELNVLNPPPYIQGLSVSGGYNEIIISYHKIVDSDLVDLKFYMDDTDPDFVANDATNLEKSLGNTPASPSYITSYKTAAIEGGQTYFVKWVAVDDFGPTPSSQSIAVATNLGALDLDLADWAFQVDPLDRTWIMDHLQADSIPNERIESITSAKITTGVLNATVAVNSDGWIKVSDAHYGANSGEQNAGVVGIHEVVLGPRQFSKNVLGEDDSVRTAFFSFSQNNIPLAAFYTDGECVFRGKIIVEDGSNVEAGATAGATWDTNIKNQPLTLAEFEAAYQAQADSKIVVRWSATAPGSPDIDDLWVDTGNDDVVTKWNGASWEATDQSKLAKAVIQAVDDPAKADGLVVLFLHEEDPENNFSPVEGDLWYQPSTQLLSRYNQGTLAWEVASNNFITTSQLLDDALLKQPHWDFIREKPQWVQDFKDEMIEQLDGNIVVVYQDDEPDPSGYAQGDLWFDTDDGIWYRHNNAVWEVTTKNGIIEALEKAYTAEAAADGSIRTYFTNVEPTTGNTPTLSFGDLWFNPDTELVKQWDGANWRPFSPTKTSSLDDDAELGKKAEWYRLDGLPSRFDDTATNGVNITPTHMGIYQNGWRVYMDYLGRFILNDGDPDHFITWNGSTLSVRGEVRATDIKAQSTIVGSTWKTADFGERIEVDHSKSGLIFYDDTNRQVIYLGRDYGEDANLIIDKSHSGGVSHGIKIKAAGYGVSVTSNYYGLGVTCNGTSYPAAIITGNNTVGVYGASHADGSDKGVGVFGFTSGINSIGVKGISRDAANGVGVYGESFCGVYGKTIADSNGQSAPYDLPDPVTTSENPENIDPIAAPENVVASSAPVSYHRLTETDSAPSVKDSIGDKDMVWIGTYATTGPKPRASDIIGDGDPVVVGQINGTGGIKLESDRLIDDASGSWSFNCLVVSTDNSGEQTLMSQWDSLGNPELEIKLVGGVVNVLEAGVITHASGSIGTGQFSMITVVKSGVQYSTYINGAAA